MQTQVYILRKRLFSGIMTKAITLSNSARCTAADGIFSNSNMQQVPANATAGASELWQLMKEDHVNRKSEQMSSKLVYVSVDLVR